MIQSAITAAKQAGAIIKERFTATLPHSITYKDSNNIVTETDVAAEQAIFAIVKKEFPNHAFFSEENGLQQTDSEYLWIIDPLDGTSNFARGLPFFCVSIALFQNNQPLFGVIYDPIHDELFTAEVGKGAFLNNNQITSNNTDALNTSVLLMGRGSSQASKQRHAQLYNHIISHTRTTRVLGSAALSIAYVASGRFDAMIMNDCNFYDCAAANVIARQAGALVSDFSGSPLTSETGGTSDILVTNKNLQPAILGILSSRPPSRDPDNVDAGSGPA